MVVFLGEGIFTMGYSKNNIMYWGFTFIIIPPYTVEVCTNMHKLLNIFCAISTITPGRLLQTHLCRSFLYQVAALHKDPVPSYVLVILFLPSGNFHQ